MLGVLLKALKANKEEAFVLIQDLLSTQPISAPIYQDILLESARLGADKIVELLARHLNLNPGGSAALHLAMGKALHLAASKNDITMVRILINGGADVNQLTNDSKGESPLLIAVEKGHIEVVRQLIAAKVKVNQPRTSGVEPVYVPPKKIRKSVNPAYVAFNRRRNGGGFVPTMYDHYINLAERLGVPGHKIIQIDENYFVYMEATPLQVAVVAKQIEIVNLLMAAGADVNQPAYNGATPLSMAVENGHTEIVNLLIVGGADVDRGNNSGVTPLYKAAENGHITIANLLITAGADVNQPNNDGITPLHATCHRGHNFSSKIAELLVTNGADIDKKTLSNYGRTLLRDAAREQRVKLTYQLLLAGAEIVSDTNSPNSSISHMLNFCSGREVSAPFIKEDAFLLIARSQGSRKHQLKTLNQILEEGKFSINIQDDDGNTLLHHAAISGKDDLTKFLLANGANSFAKNKTDKLPKAMLNTFDLVRNKFLFFREEKLPLVSQSHKEVFMLLLLSLCNSNGDPLRPNSQLTRLPRELLSLVLENLAGVTVEGKTPLALRAP